MFSSFGHLRCWYFRGRILGSACVIVDVSMLTVRFTSRRGGQVILIIGSRVSDDETIVFSFAWWCRFLLNGVCPDVSTGLLSGGVLLCGGFVE